MLINSFEDRTVRTQQKRETVLRFLRDETWSNLTNLASALELSEPATFKTLSRMERDGLLHKFKINELRLNIWGITPLGLAFAWRLDETMQLRPHFEPSKLSIINIRHYLDIQRARLIAERVGWTSWIPGNRLPKDLKKRPDAVAIDNKGQTIAIEIERKIKTIKRYEAIFSIYLQMIKRDMYTKVHYVCPDASFALRLARMFELIKAVPVAGERVLLNENHRARLSVFALDSWPPNNDI